MYGFQITEEDVETVLKKHAVTVGNSDGVTFAEMASDIFSMLDHGAIERAALHGDELEEQTRYAYDAIAAQLRDPGVLETSRTEEEAASLNEPMKG